MTSTTAADEQRRPRFSMGAVLYFTLVLASVAGVVGYEKSTGHFLDGTDAISTAFLTCLVLAAIGSVLRVSARSFGLALAVVIIGVGVIWYVPSGPREVFADAVSLIDEGMGPEEVEAIMAGYEAGNLPEWPARSRSIRTYYAAPGEDDVFDCFCMVTWEDGRVSRVQIHVD